MTHFRLQRHGNLWLEFDGELIAEADSDDGAKPRWQHLRLYRVDGGKYVLERMGESRLPGEVCMRHVDEIPNAYQVRRRLERKRDDGGEKYLTIIALDLLGQAAEHDQTFHEVTAERI